MFEQELLGGRQERRIRLDTHLGHPIRNVIAPEVGEAERRRYALTRNQYGEYWINRKPATGVYNCYGMVFASRRTCIIDDEQDTATNRVQRILDDDGYRKLPSDADVRVGDLVLYRDDNTREFLHVAVVLRREPIVGAPGAIGPLWALSKWNDTCGEDEHHVRHHCWTEQETDLEFWTDRPEP